MLTTVAEKKMTVISTFEMFGIFVLFCSLLIAFFPKDKIEYLVTKESSNYSLSVQYLTNIIDSYPNDTRAKFMLVEIYLKMHYFDEATLLLETLPQADEYKKKLNSLQYDIAKARYFSSTVGKNHGVYIIEMEKILRNMMLLATSKKELLFLLDEAKSMNFQHLRVTVEIMMIKNNFLTQHQAAETFEQARFLKMDKEANELLILGLKDTKDIEWIKIAGDYYISTKNYSTAISMYKTLLNKDLPASEKKKIFEKLLTLYIAEKKSEDAIEMIEEYEEMILKNDDLIKKTIKFYLAHDRLDLAKKFSLKIYKNRYPVGI